MKANWLLLILLFFVFVSSCDDDDDSNVTEKDQYIRGTIDSVVYEFNKKIRAVYNSDDLNTDIYFSMYNPIRFDTIRMALFNADLEEIDLIYEFKYPNKPNTDLYAGIVMKDKSDSFEYTLISGFKTNTWIKIESIWYKQMIGSFNGWFYNNSYIDFMVHDPPAYVDSFKVEKGSFYIELEKK